MLRGQDKEESELTLHLTEYSGEEEISVFIYKGKEEAPVNDVSERIRIAQRLGVKV